MNRENRTRAAMGGMFAGIVGGVALTVFNVGMNLARGHDVWAGLKFAGMPLLGARAGSPGLDMLAIVIGLSAHFAVSIAWGLLFGLVFEALSPKLRETAYALAVEVAASDLAVGKEELRFLAMLRDHLGLDKLVTAALERGAIARYQTE